MLTGAAAPSAWGRLGWAAAVAACAVAGAAGVLLLHSPLFALVTAGVFATGALLARTPVRTTLLWAFFLVLVCDAPQDRPADGLWRSPLYWVGAFWVNNLGKTLGIGALNFSTLDVLVAVILSASVLRWAFVARKESGSTLPRPVQLACWAVLAAFCFWTGVGVVRGGDPITAYWQLRQIVYVPLLALLLGRAGLGGAPDLRFAGRAVIAAACVKVAFGAFFYFAIARLNGWSPKYVTSHADTVLFSLAIVTLAARWLLAPTRRHLFWLLGAGAWIGLGIFLNDRRIAYLAIAASLLLIFFVTPKLRTKRWVIRACVALAPLAALYVGAGWTSEAAVFRPVQSVRTMFAPEEDSSTESRHIENANLARTLAEAPLLGKGFGHEYTEYELGPDIGQQFKMYKAIPHNAVLAFMYALGLVGFVILGTFWALTSTVAVRAFHTSHTLEERVACLSAAAMVLLYVLQAWGDMGTQNWGGAFLLAMGIALSGAIAQRRGVLGGRGGETVR